MDDDPITSWNERIDTLRKRGRVSAAALAVAPPEDVDVRRSRPPPPERLSEAERALFGLQPASWVVRCGCGEPFGELFV